MKWQYIIHFLMILCAMGNFLFGNPNGENLETIIWSMWEKIQELRLYRLQDNRA